MISSLIVVSSALLHMEGGIAHAPLSQSRAGPVGQSAVQVRPRARPHLGTELHLPQVDGESEHRVVVPAGVWSPHASVLLGLDEDEEVLLAPAALEAGKQATVLVGHRSGDSLRQIEIIARSHIQVRGIWKGRLGVDETGHYVLVAEEFRPHRPPPAATEVDLAQVWPPGVDLTIARPELEFQGGRSFSPLVSKGALSARRDGVPLILLPIDSQSAQHLVAANGSPKWRIMTATFQDPLSDVTIVISGKVELDPSRPPALLEGLEGLDPPGGGEIGDRRWIRSTASSRPLRLARHRQRSRLGRDQQR